MSLSNGYSDRFVLAFFVSMEDLGKYGKAYLVGTALGMLFDSLMMLWWPYVISKKDSFFVLLFPKVKRAYMVTVFLSFLMLASLVFVRWFGFALLPVVEVSLVLVAAFFARVGYQVFVPVLNTYDRTRVSAKISFYGAMVGLALNFALIPVYGIYGAAYATWGAFLAFSALAYLETIKVFYGYKNETRV
jgi:O-antigen/teichoic acid export membrane protein